MQGQEQAGTGEFGTEDGKVVCVCTGVTIARYSLSMEGVRAEGREARTVMRRRGKGRDGERGRIPAARMVRCGPDEDEDDDEDEEDEEEDEIGVEQY
jgi:hypothetical protein